MPELRYRKNFLLCDAVPPLRLLQLCLSSRIVKITPGARAGCRGRQDSARAAHYSAPPSLPRPGAARPRAGPLRGSSRSPRHPRERERPHPHPAGPTPRPGGRPRLPLRSRPPCPAPRRRGPCPGGLRCGGRGSGRFLLPRSLRTLQSCSLLPA